MILVHESLLIVHSDHVGYVKFLSIQTLKERLTVNSIFTIVFILAFYDVEYDCCRFYLFY